MKIAVALSGGVDSTAAAVELLDQGLSLFGVTMKHYDPSKYGFAPGEGIDADIKDAKEVCDQLGIRHHVIDLRSEFNNIINYLIDEYSCGKTPNPCTLCNPTIKWGALLEKSLELGAEKIATGHYVDLRNIDGSYQIHRAKDYAKDQTYMLWQLSQKQLAHTLFPNSKRTKQEIRKLTRNLNLPVHDKDDSQEICFIKGQYQTFLDRNIDFEEGDIIFRDGKKIGTHKGLHNYTIGQRKGLNLPWTSALYVSEIDPFNNTIRVTDDQNDLMQKKFKIHTLNWIEGKPPENFADISVQIRYNSHPQPLKKLVLLEDTGSVILKNPVRAVTPGQSAVFYREDRLLGGGIIQ